MLTVLQRRCEVLAAALVRAATATYGSVCSYKTFLYAFVINSLAERCIFRAAKQGGTHNSCAPRLRSAPQTAPSSKCSLRKEKVDTVRIPAVDAERIAGVCVSARF